MGGSRIRRATAVTTILALVAVAAGCEWVLPGYGPAGTRHNTAEADVGVADVPTLTADRVAPLGSSAGTTAIPLVKSNVLLSVSDGRIRAFAVDGSQGCTTAALPSCSPIWSSAPGIGHNQPIIDGDRVLAIATGGELRVYDLAGVDGCSGTPVVCTGVGTVPGFVGAGAVGLPGFVGLSAAGGRIYEFWGEVQAYDRASLLACAAAAQPCEPVWESWVDIEGGGFDYGSVTEVAISGGFLYTLTRDRIIDAADVIGVQAYDLAGCEAASPCEAIWGTSRIGANWSPAAIAVEGDTVVISTDPWDTWDPEYASDQPGRVAAYSVGACASVPYDPCGPIWTADVGETGPVAIADGVVYVAAGTWVAAERVAAFDLAGVAGCGGSPKVCEPIRTLVDPANGLQGWSPIVADGVVHLGPDAWAADGSVECSGTPVVCTPLRSGGTPAEVIVVNGRVHLQQTPTGGSAKLVTQTPR